MAGDGSTRGDGGGTGGEVSGVTGPTGQLPEGVIFTDIPGTRAAAATFDRLDAVAGVVCVPGRADATGPDLELLVDRPVQRGPGEAAGWPIRPGGNSAQDAEDEDKVWVRGL